MPPRALTATEATIASAAGVEAFAAILAGPPVSRILAVPAGLRLGEPSTAAPSARPSAPLACPNGVPRDEVEQTLAQWWQELLGVDHVSIHQDFFELGGHSLIAVRLFTKIKNHFGLELGRTGGCGRPSRNAGAGNIGSAAACTRGLRVR